MELAAGIQERRSIRGFQPEPISRETLTEVLKLAVRAVSSNNTQPWEFAVITGEPLDKLRQANLRDLDRGAPEDYPNIPLEGACLDRARTVGRQLFAAMEIARQDKEQRNWWGRRGYAFFDAPAAILLYMDKSLDEATYRFDMGCVAQNICLAAMEYGLGTCVENQAITYQNGIREILSIPESKRLVCGIAIGYTDWDFPANSVVSTREAPENITSWYGF